MERAVSGPLRTGRPYGYHVIVSSMAAAPLALDVLVQVPQVSCRPVCLTVGSRQRPGLCCRSSSETPEHVWPAWQKHASCWSSEAGLCAAAINTATCLACESIIANKAETGCVILQGALPLEQKPFSWCIRINVSPYTSVTLDLSFYFPRPSDTPSTFHQFPVCCSCDLVL